MKTDAQMGWIANVVVGVVGSSRGGWLAPQLGVPEQGFMVYVVAVGGAALPIVLLKILRSVK